MKLISISALTGAVLCGFVSASSPAVTSAATVQTAPLSAPTTEEIIIRPPEVVRRALPRTGLGTPPGLTNPENISLTHAVSYSDLDLSKASDLAELGARVRNTARDVCQELSRRYPRTGGQYVYANVDCVRKATNDGMVTVRAISGK
jgi:UrcA family protein